MSIRGNPKNSFKWLVISRYTDMVVFFHTQIGRISEKLKYKKYLMEFGERDDDIYIAAFPKSGTTWVQMILYQLTTDGRMDFNHISDISPWIRKASVLDQPIGEIPSPRIIKTHDRYKEISRNIKGRFIYIIRNGMDVAASAYHHIKDYDDPRITFDESIGRWFMLDKKFNWFTHVSEWIKNKNKHQILCIRYEDLTQDPEAMIRKIAAYCNLEVKESELPRILERSSFRFMKKYEKKFGKQPNEGRVYDNFIRKGVPYDGHRYFNDAQKEAYTNNFKKYFNGFELMKMYDPDKLLRNGKD